MSRLVADGPPTPDHKEFAKRMENECHRKAVERGQQTFTVVEQDITAPLTILKWIELQIVMQGNKAPAGKLRDAFEDVLSMLYSDIEKKYAD